MNPNLFGRRERRAGKSTRFRQLNEILHLFFVRDSEITQLPKSLITQNPTDPCFDWKRPCVGGVDLQKQRSLGLYIYSLYGYWDSLESDFWYGSNYRNHTF